MFNDSTFNCLKSRSKEIAIFFFLSSKFSRKGVARSNIPNSKTVWWFKGNKMIMILNQIQNRILIEHFLTT